MLRTFWSSGGDGYQPLVFSGLSSRKAGLALRTSSGSGGQTGGPPSEGLRVPLTARRESRSISAVSRCGEKRQRSRLEESLEEADWVFGESVED